MKYSDKLRKFADYLDARPDLEVSEWEYPSLCLYAKDAEEFGKFVRAMGEGEKDRSVSTLTFTYSPKESVTRSDKYGGYEAENCVFWMQTLVSGVCEAKPTGRKVTKRVPRYNYEEVEVDEVEYHCPEVWSKL